MLVSTQGTNHKYTYMAGKGNDTHIKLVPMPSKNGSPSVEGKQKTPPSALQHRPLKHPHKKSPNAAPGAAIRLNLPNCSNQEIHHYE